MMIIPSTKYLLDHIWMLCSVLAPPEHKRLINSCEFGGGAAKMVRVWSTVREADGAGFGGPKKQP